MSASPFGALAVIADPAAGEGSVGAKLPAIRAAIAQQGLEFRLVVASSAADASRLASAALDEGYRYLAAVGDDRTVQDVLNGMFRDGATIVADAVLGVVPAGTGCDIVRTFGLPGDVDAAAGHLSGGNVYPFDVMKLQVTGPGGVPVVRYAHNLIQIGLHAAASRRASRLPRALGGGRRFLGFWSAYLTGRARQLHVITDAKTHDLRAWSVVVGNGQFADGGLRLSPRSFPGDGIMEALVFTGPKSDAYRLLPRVFRHGGHVPDPGVTELKAKIAVRVESPTPLPVVADGAFLGTTPAVIQLIPQPIRLKL